MSSVRTLLLTCTAMICCHAPLSAQPAAPAAAALPGATYASLQDLPDWSGWWHVVPVDPPRGVLQPPLLRLLGDPAPPLKPELLPQVRDAIANMLRRGGRDYCGPRRFVGFQNGDGFEDAIELLLTPGRVTLTNEIGLLRRIYTDGRPLPMDAEESHSGTSIGRWEGQTLVVETVGLTRSSRFPLEIVGAPPIGTNVKVVERISLRNPSTLEIDSELTAPELLLAPYRVTTVYVREPGYVARELGYCADSDRLVDHDTGALRFDLTPPPDLPSASSLLEHAR